MHAVRRGYNANISVRDVPEQYRGWTGVSNAVESIYVQEWSVWVSVGEVTMQPYSKSCAGNMHVTVMPSAG